MIVAGRDAPLWALAMAAALGIAACGSGSAGGTDGGSGEGPACTRPEVHPRPVDPSRRRFAMTVFHFNIEYVMGGLDGDGERYEPLCGETCAGWDNQAVEDWIVRESFAPVVDFYLEHPQWGANIEVQAYMIEVIAERFPDLLPKLRTLVARGQIELSSFHYADQLFLAFPARDLERSQAQTRAVFEATCLPLSPVVFDQEGQAGAGWLRWLAPHGYRVGIFPKNLYRYQHGSDASWWPLYADGDARMIVGPGGVDPESGVEFAWPFFDDGELLAVSGGLAPYLAPMVEYDPARLDAFAKTLSDLEARGFLVTTVSDVVAHLEAAGIEARPVPPLLDGTWQAPSTDSIHRWLGGRGQAPYWPDEQDVAVRSGNYEASLRLAAAHLAWEHLGLRGPEATGPLPPFPFDDADRALFHAEVSDGSGVNPWAAEIYWSLDHNDAVLGFADRVLEWARARLGTPHIVVDLEEGTVRGTTELPRPAYAAAPAPLSGVTAEGGGRSVTLTWEAAPELPGRTRLTVRFGPGTDPDLDRILRVTFPRSEERLRFSPGLVEDEVVDWPLSDFTLDWGEAYLPLANGLIGLGSNLWVIKHNRVEHLAARVDAAEPVIEFIDEVAPLEPVTWVFDLVEGDAGAALAAARAINTHATVTH